ncbi:uncharacterized protein DS421_11g328460 [Arachis hypogaea]|nr:uncharacterized protein DS421_11g328460 [Arachis hypogaea]
MRILISISKIWPKIGPKGPNRLNRSPNRTRGFNRTHNIKEASASSSSLHTPRSKQKGEEEEIPNPHPIFKPPYLPRSSSNRRTVRGHASSASSSTFLSDQFHWFKLASGICGLKLLSIWVWYFLAEIEGPEQKSDSEAEKGLQMLLDSDLPKFKVDFLELQKPNWRALNCIGK